MIVQCENLLASIHLTWFLQFIRWRVGLYEWLAAH